MKLKSALLLFLLLLCHPLLASSLFAPDSVPQHTNLLPIHVPTEKYNHFALSGNPFIYDRMLSPFQFDSTICPLAGDFRFGMNPYQQYLDYDPSLIPLDTNLGVSLIRIVLGSKREQLLFLDHHQRISKHLSGSVAYNSIVSPGFLLNCFSFYRRFNIGLNYESALLHSTLNFKYGRIEADENGGIKDGQSIEGISKSTFEQLQTFLPDDKRKARRYQADFKNAVLLWSTQNADSVKKFNFLLNADFAWYKWGTAYTGTTDSAFYQNNFLDSLVTNDTSGYSYYKAQPSLSVLFSGEHSSILLNAGVGLFYLKQRIDSLKQSLDYSSTFLNLLFKTRAFSWSVDARRVISNNYNDGDYSLFSEMFVGPAGNVLSGISVSVGNSEVSPEATSEYYSSNHFRWNNDFQKEKFSWLHANFSFANNAIQVYGQLTNVEHLVYFNNLSLPLQSESSSQIIMAGVKLDYCLKKWRVVGDARWMYSSKEIIRVPEFGGYLRFSFRDRFFKNALFAEFGTSFYGLSEWKSYAFMPATGISYLQSSEITGGAPTLDLFVNADIGRATLTIMLQRVNDGLFGGENYIAPGYPAPPRTLKFGVLWKLFN